MITEHAYSFGFKKSNNWLNEYTFSKIIIFLCSYITVTYMFNSFISTKITLFPSWYNNLFHAIYFFNLNFNSCIKSYFQTFILSSLLLNRVSVLHKHNIYCCLWNKTTRKIIASTMLHHDAYSNKSLMIKKLFLRISSFVSNEITSSWRKVLFILIKVLIILNITMRISTRSCQQCTYESISYIVTPGHFYITCMCWTIS